MKLKDALTEQGEVNKLLTRMRLGDEDARSQFIEGHTRFAATIALRFAQRFPAHRDDLISESFLILCQCAEFLSNNNHENPVGYITTRVKGAMVNYLKRIHTVSGVPKAGDIAPLQMPMPDLGAQTGMTELQIDLNEFSKKLDPKEREVFDLRRQGLNDVEIADQLGVTKRWIGVLRERYSVAWAAA